ncbi:TlrC/CarA/OleB/SrmB family ABC-F type ribosomal protection protein [Nocardiopsis dassonvillei]|uniref:TlrC/CarA/OleB/SrmB family ABC-F type ribosomal protection protein n=1 Tax=Nocardiopsis dassonvillei TaxID=2014 RepID=UPI000B9D7101|nr:TlrC/CarA/OleB/SrmB family ABC-F type ribosomal protection protein [Nocardiopsis dassonvillei]ASU61121.1 tylosin resistance protein TlrC [Nocardiopsis dassonvillei]
MLTARVRAQSQLTLNDITHRYGDHTVLDRVTLTISPGERVGIIGDNGSGKSTLLRLLAGEEEPTNGDLTVRAPGGTGYLPQTLEAVGVSTGTVGDAIDSALAVLRDMEARLRAAESTLGSAAPEELDTYGDLLARFEARGGYDVDARVDAGLHGLGLPGLDRDRPLRTLSGGERSRLALAAMLAASPELLLLDEPTNDLDDRAVAWLEDRLRRHRGTVVAVTHDRAFLANVTDTVLEVDHDLRRIHRYGNGYDGFLAAKASARARWIREYEEWRADLARQRRLAENSIAALKAIPRKMEKAAFGHGAFKMRGAAHGSMGRVRNAKERVERLTNDPVAPPPVPLRMTAGFTGSRTGESAPAASLEGVRVDHRLEVPCLDLAPGERVLVTGPNGAGKTTLLRLLSGDAVPDEGRVSVPGRVGYLRQEDGSFAAGQTVLGAYAAGRPGYAEDHRDELASLGLFRPGELDQPVASLSVGQRRRIEVARLTSGAYDLLLLDEPTNHLSPGLVEDLEEALTRYEGTLVVVTHDRRTRQRFTGRHLELREGIVVSDSA